LLVENIALFDALKEFYSALTANNLLKGWISAYRGTSALTIDMGRQIIVKTISFLLRINPYIFQDFEESLKWSINLFFSSEDWNDILYVDMFNNFVINGWVHTPHQYNSSSRLGLEDFVNWLKDSNTIPADYLHEGFIVLISEKMKSYGVLENYFYTIISPKNMVHIIFGSW
jgi:hypothetical protein